MNSSSNPLKILVVEDDPAFAKMLRLLLKQKFAADTVIAEDCSSARNLLSTDVFQVITLDFQLPDGNGLELLEEITATEEHPPVIMVTGHGDEKTASGAIGIGADGYVVKDKKLRVLLGGAVERALERENCRKALGNSERQYRELVELANSIILKMDREGNVVFINRYGSEFFGYSEEELIGRNVVGTIVPEVESTGRGLFAMIRDIVSEPDAHRLNFNENMLRDGKRVWILWANRSIRDETGSVVGTLSIGNDVTELQRSTANLEHLTGLYSLIISAFKKLMRAGDPRESFDEICSVAVKSGFFKQAWIGLLDEATGDVVLSGSAGNEDFLESARATLDTRDNPGLWSAVRERRRHVCNDILRDRGMEPWWKEAVKRGYCSYAVFPLTSCDRVFGVFNLYASTPGFFNDEIVNLLESLAAELSFAVESLERGRSSGPGH